MHSRLSTGSTVPAVIVLAALLTAALLAVPALGQAPDTVNPQVTLQTSKGDIVIELFAQEAPKSTANFLAYVDAGFYDGTIFHRVIPDFMVQGGGFTADLRKKETRQPITNEADNGMKNERGTLAMARTNDPHSATAQFFINSVDNKFLNHTAKTAQGWGYAVFGRVVSGMDVVDAISAVATGRRAGMGDVPMEPVTLLEARRHSAAASSSP